MNAWQGWGVNLILSLQQLSPALDGVMKFLTFLGLEDFYMLIVPVLYWCLDAALGFRMLSALVLSNYANGVFKWAFHAPRPYWLDVRVRALSVESSYGIPSGHAQNAVAVWGLIARVLRSAWAWVAAVVLILGISLSRVYLGVHFPHDIAGGWVIGAGVLVAYLWAEPRAVNWLRPKSLGYQIGAAFALSAILLGLALGVRAAISGVADAPAWAATAALAAPPAAGGRATDPRNMESLFSAAGTVFGGGAGFVLMRRYAQFDARGMWWKRILRYGLGLAVLMGLRIGLSAVFPDEPLALALPLRYLRYTLMLLWATWLAPWVFIRLGLATGAGSDG